MMTSSDFSFACGYANPAMKATRRNDMIAFIMNSQGNYLPLMGLILPHQRALSRMNDTADRDHPEEILRSPFPCLGID
jgi:hypothetical protein